MYDPVQGRMLSPDNYVATPFGTQGYNRYAYALNNPLKYTDPDGELVHLVVSALIGGSINWLVNGAEFSWKGLGYFGIGATAGALSAGIGAGVNVAMAGGSFGAGFMGTAAGVSTTGFIAGAATGASAGLTNGFITGMGNTALNGGTLGESALAGLNSGWKQGLVGGVTGGIFGGIDAMRKDVNFFTGKAQMDLSNGFGAHGVSTDQTILGKYVGQYKYDKSVSVYEADIDGGVTLPGRGIIVTKGAYSRNLYPRLMQHEYGHILQAREVGYNAFYSVIAKESLISAAMDGKLGHDHSYFWTETWANYLSSNKLGSNYLPSSGYPIKNISSFNLFRLRLASPFFWP